MWLAKNTARTDEFSMRGENPATGGLRCVWEIDNDRDLPVTDAAVIDTPFVGAMRWDPTATKVYVRVNGTQTNENNSTTGTFTVDDIILGWDSNSVDSVVGELVIVASNDPAVEQQIEGYLAWKWGLQANLPDSHPYRFAPPVKGRAVKSTLWTPDEISTAAWYDAADTSPTNIVQSGGAVSQWSDKSGNSKHATQGTVLNQPITNSRTMNGKNTLDFNGVDSFMDAPAFGVTNPASVFFVFEVDNVGSYMIIDRGAGFDRFVNDGKSYPQIFVDSRFGGLPTGMPTTGSHLVSKQCDTTSTYDTYLNGTLAHSADATLKTFTDAVSIIGGTAAGAGNRLDGAISEIVILDENPSTATRQIIEGYLAWKWGLQRQLPIDHPYRTTPPTV
jgi:hypothetical protein